ncbi:MAG: hypothetical protein LBF37_03355, partial [Rickettsiales bacterium]|nr:hypothetical protein [Rickettsiales bacterium]
MDDKKLIEAVECGGTVKYREKQLDKIAGQMSESRNIEFARYLTGRFTTAIRSSELSGFLENWAGLSIDDKKLFTKKFLDILWDLLI